ncbi:MAG: TetR/AcrR family transcriptional regulator [Betaproteobacteria bacterium]|jgi:AcrR family transcriptional regulator|nr:TetR/AcrR family transcriptional regulator [Betaproteobacteria bacterium]MDH5287637.1 TetR/AcrR family transcriptional regulator [Betaproteobacteria bacterium]
MERKRPRRTRERILETGLALFNRFGEPNITTADIADEMGISPGNLYYHFRNKDEIVGELYAALEARALPLLDWPEGRTPDVEDLWFVLHALFEAMWAYRFFYRDVVELTSRNRRIALRFAEFVRRGEASVTAMCRGMVAAGTMRASERELAALAQNVSVIASYWMSYQRTAHPPPPGKPAGDDSGLSLERAAYQVLSLIAPFALGEARLRIERLGERYL